MLLLRDHAKPETLERGTSTSATMDLSNYRNSVPPALQSRALLDDVATFINLKAAEDSCDLLLQIQYHLPTCKMATFYSNLTCLDLCRKGNAARVNTC
ncbi:hypothetical protein CVT26_001028 [Gymnopilus dilepis]|uniref:Uncharacterized protein n=1 Tax=Gymnopilus dilepis TaxID=231916 RepID=A0A409X517_9AGAR|nr:hypothetical protein CVT26_001028 [Gymnopilus dilepis]